MNAPVANTTPWRHAPTLQRAGILIALSAAVLKATVGISGFPGWELDPFSLPAPASGLGPAGSMMCDTAIGLGVVLMVLARHLAGKPLRLLDAALFFVGAAGVLLHMFTRSPSIGDTWIGSSWLAAMMLALGAATVASTDSPDAGNRARAMFAAVFLGLVALLAVRGAQQVFIEHPATLSDFKRNRDAIFAAQGWSPDSPMAKAYERRLSQPEATGWFGLANVYATLAAAGAVMAAFLLIGAIIAYRRDSSRKIYPAMLAGAIVPVAAGVGGLWLAGAKGGVVAALLGVAAGVALRAVKPSWPFSRRAGGIITLGALAATFALVILRGALADRIGELSILFRWFYMQAATRIGLESLPLGVGPDGFQAAYTLAKNPLSPEDVASSHNMLLDWFATLGVFGIAWIALWLLWVWRAGNATVTAPAPPAPELFTEEDTARTDRWTLAAIGTLATLAAIRIDQDILSPDLAIARLAGLVIFCAVGWTVLSLWRHLNVRWTSISLAAAAAAAAAHGLIDVTGTWPGSCAILAALVGASAGGRAPTQISATTSPPRRTAHIVIVVILLALSLASWPWRILGWEREVRSAALIGEQVGALRQRWSETGAALQARRPGAADDARAIAADLESLLARQIRTPAEIDLGVRDFDLRTSRTVAEKLGTLSRRFPVEWKLRREASRVKLREASLLETAGQPAAGLAARTEAERIASSAPPSAGRTASEWAWIGLIRESLISSADAANWGAEAAAAFEAATKLAPYELEYPLRLMHLHERLGAPEQARAWARKALELDAAAKYDKEVKGLSPQHRQDARRLSGGI